MITEIKLKRTQDCIKEVQNMLKLLMNERNVNQQFFYALKAISDHLDVINYMLDVKNV